MLKRLLAFVITVALVLNYVVFTSFAATYSNASEWAKEAISEAEKNNLISKSLIGTDMTKPITRKEFAALSVRLYEEIMGVAAAPASTNPFTDTNDSEVLKAYGLGITSGTSVTTFAPNDQIPREQVATMLSRTIKTMVSDADFSVSGAPSFTDQKSISTWALDHVLYMAKLGIINGSDGKFLPGFPTTREQSIAMSVRIFARFKSQVTPVSYGWEYIAINDFEIPKSDYLVKRENGLANIYLPSDKIEFAFKFPTLLLKGVSTYMEYREVDNNINIYWTFENKPLFQVDMVIGSSNVNIDGIAYDFGAAPFRQDGNTFIPISVFIELFDMKLLEDDSSNRLFIQFKEDFPVEQLIGSWSDVYTDLFTTFKDGPSGVESLSSYAQGNYYNSDGTCQLIVVSVGGFYDGLVMQKGKYMVMGQTIVHYDMVETYYKGTPFVLQYKDKPVVYPNLDFISDYNPDTNEIRIGGFWLHLVE